MRFIIYGAGAIGGVIGARLFLIYQDVVFLALGPLLQAIQSSGLKYLNPEGAQTLAMPVVEHPAEIKFEADDVILLTMKSQHTEQALNDLAANAPPDIPVICCQNGVANETMAARKFNNVYGMVVMLPATHLNPGEVLHHATGVGGFLDACRFANSVDAVIVQVCTELTAAGFSARPDPDAMRWKYAKLLQNLANALIAVCDVNPANATVMKLLRTEALACYAAAGIDCATAEQTKARFGQGMIRGRIEGEVRGGGSSWQSLRRGTGDIEADYLNGEICMLGRRYSVPTPANDIVRTLANEVARKRLDPGQYTVDQVMEKIHAAP